MNHPLACPACALPFKPDDVRDNGRVAACRACDVVYPIAQRWRPAASQPKGWTRAAEGGGIVLRHRWFGLHAFFFVVWCVLWNGGLLDAMENEGAAVFLMFHALVGLGVVYFTLCTFVNTSTITVRRGTLTLAHGPLPWPNGITLATKEIDQLYVEEGRSNRQTHYHVLALCSDGVARRVSPQLTDREAGRWIEQEIEAQLGIADRAVANEA